MPPIVLLLYDRHCDTWSPEIITREGIDENTKQDLILFFSFLFSNMSYARNDAPKVVLPGVHCYHGVDHGVGQVMGDLILEALLNRHEIRALGPTDVSHMLKAQEQKDLLGCDEENCLVELAGTLGADWLIGGSVGKLDDVYVLSLILIDSRKNMVTRRVSQTIDKLRNAPSTLGPMMDKLLGNKARPQQPLPALKHQKKQSIGKKPWTLSEYRQHFISYKNKLEKGPIDGRWFAKARKQLLQDLLVTSMPQDFEAKRIVMFSYSGGLMNELLRQRTSSVTDEAVLDARKRMNEWLVFKRQMEKLDYAYKRGLKMEEVGSGTRLSSIPFDVNPSVLQKPPSNDVVITYLEKWDEGKATINLALESLRKKNFKEFASLWSVDAKANRGKIPSRYKELQKRLSQGYTYRPCLRSMLTATEVERAAEYLRKNGKLQICFVYLRDKFASMRKLYLKFEGNSWRIDNW